MGKLVSGLPSPEGYRLWAATYDRDPNPLLALEERVAGPLLGSLSGKRVLDLCAGTGRWMSIVMSLKARAIGIDLSPEMLYQASRKNGLAGRLLRGDIARLPVRHAAFDLAICSFGISYIRSLDPVFLEMARISRRLVVSDMHPAGLRAGWSRSFEIAARKYRMTHYIHSFDEIERAAAEAGFHGEYSVEACFGEPERRLFEDVGKGRLWEQLLKIPAVFVKSWRAS